MGMDEMEEWRRWFQQGGRDLEVEMLAQKASGHYWEVHPPSLENWVCVLLLETLHGAPVTLLCNWGIIDQQGTCDTRGCQK